MIAPKLNEAMLQAFLMLEETPISERQNSGICQAMLTEDLIVAFCAYELQDAMTCIFEAWPGYSGWAAFPLSPFSEYWRELDTHTIWQNERRIDLLEFCIFYCVMNTEA